MICIGCGSSEKSAESVQLAAVAQEAAAVTEEAAKTLLKRLKGLPAHMNLIPLNHVEESPLKPSSRSAVMRFQQILEEGGVTATVRRTLGGDIDASCGQLRRKYTKQNEN